MKNNIGKTAGIRFMKSIVLLVLAGSFIACGSEHKNTAEKIQKGTSGQNYSYLQKDQFVEKMNQNLAEVNKSLADFGTTVKKANGEARIEAERKMKELRIKAARLNMKIDKVRNSTESEWENVKSDFNKFSNEMKDSVDQMRTWLSEKVAP